MPPTNTPQKSTKQAALTSYFSPRPAGLPSSDIKRRLFESLDNAADDDYDNNMKDSDITPMPAISNNKATSQTKKVAKTTSEKKTNKDTDANKIKDNNSKQQQQQQKGGKLPNIKWTLAQLKEEALTRGYDEQSLPKKKADVLALLLSSSTNHQATKTTSMKQEKNSSKPIAKKAKKQQQETSSKASTATAAPGAAKPAEPASKRPKTNNKKQPNKTETSNLNSPTPDLSKSSAAEANQKPPPSPVQSKNDNKATKKRSRDDDDDNTKQPVKKRSKPAATKKAKKPGDQPPKNTSKKSSNNKNNKADNATTTATTTSTNHNSTNVANTSQQPVDFPRICKSMTALQLIEEGLARGYSRNDLPKTKMEILYFLLDGSICLSQTNVWKQCLEIKNKIEQESKDLVQQTLKLKEEEAQKKMLAFQRKEQRKREEEEKREQAKIARRNQEMNQQKALHKHNFPYVHPHPLAVCSELMTHGQPRHCNSSCDICRCPFLYGGGMFAYSQEVKEGWACEQCNFDICAGCLRKENLSPKAKAKAAKEEQKRRERQRKEQEKRLRQQQEEEEKEEEERRRQWDPNVQFSKDIITLPEKNKKPDANKYKGFTVYCSDGYSPDGWHSYEGEPNKEFDSSWKTKKQANERARYLFYWKNCWGLGPEEMDDTNGSIVDTSHNDGCCSYEVEPDDSGFWRVVVVPDRVFRYLDNATTSRHNHDETRTSYSSDGYGGGVFF